MKTISTLVSIGILMTTNASYAATVSNTEISTLTVDRANAAKIFIKTTTTKPVNNPACHTSTTWAFVLPLTTDTDKALYSALLSAKSAGKKVNLVGTGDCGVFTAVETLSRVDVL